MRALAIARQEQFAHSCTNETGRLLHVLASAQRIGKVAEIGTGCGGVGAAWVVSGLSPAIPFYTVEVDERWAAAAASLFAAHANVRVMQGDWRALLADGPFDLLFLDGGHVKEEPTDDLLAAIAPGGVVVLDDLTPIDAWPPEWRGHPDRTRDFWLRDPRFAATEILEAPGRSIILAVRR